VLGFSVIKFLSTGNVFSLNSALRFAAGSEVWHFRTIKLSSAFEADLVPSALDREYPAQLTVTAPENEFENPK
jgi:hypothetical protein